MIGLWSMRHDVMAAIPALFLLVWCDLVLSALILSSVGQLGVWRAYFVISVVLAIIFTLLLLRMSNTVKTPEIVSDKVESRFLKWWVRGASWLAIFFVVIPTVLICVFYISNNSDSIAYRIPRAFFYIDQGSLSQIPGDFRIQFYPFNISLVNLWFATYGLTGVWFNLFGFTTWLVGGISVWRFARDTRAGHTASLVASAIFITSPAVLVSVSSTNDDMIAGVPLLIGALFMMRWWKSGSWFDIMLAAIALGLSFGSKLHWVMMLPIAAILFIYVLYQLKLQGKFTSFLYHRAKQVFTAICVTLILTLPIFIINLSQSGHLLPSTSGLINSPFSMATAGAHSLVSTASMLFGPIPDLNLAQSQAARQAFGSDFNNWINDHLLSWLITDQNYVADGFIFAGIGSNIANLGVGEVTVWLGFVPWLLVLVFLLLLKKHSGQLQRVAFWLVLIFFGWHLARAFMLKWVPGEGIYYAFSMALVAPAIAYLWEYKSYESGIKEVIIKGACIAVIATNLISATNYFLFNYQRSLPHLFATNYKPNQNLISPRLSQVLRASNRTLIVHNQWGLPYMQFINANPSAHYATTDLMPELPLVAFDLALIMGTAIPVEFENDDRSRLSLLGSYGLYGTQTVYGSGSVVDKLVLEQAEEIVSESKYALLEAFIAQKNAAGSLTSIMFPRLRGVSSDEDFFISATIISPSFGVVKVLEEDQFSRKPTINIPTGADAGYLIVKLKRIDSPNIVAHVWLPLNQQQNWLNISPKQRWYDTDANALITYNYDETADGFGFVSGWSPPNANLYRWMSGVTAEVTFPALKGFGMCKMDIGLISSGAADVDIYLNGEILKRIPSRDLSRSKKYHIALPSYAVTTDTNHIQFSLKNYEGNRSSLGLNAFSIDCTVFAGAKVY